ncbi:nuclease [Citrus sinensis]|nr:nuclease [Citrus sinensis]
MTSNNNICMVYYLNQLNNKVIHNGSVTGHLIINRNHEMANRNLFNDYFSKNPRFNDSMFCRRFRMSQSLFNRITNAVQDASDEYIKIGESTTIESLKIFCRAIVEVFAEQYLRSPNTNDAARLLHVRITPPAHYVIKGNEYNMGYYLADKDVKRAFEVLQSHFAIVAGPLRFWNKHELHDIMTACIIIHNMIIEDERDVNATINDWMQAPIPTVAMRVDENIRFQEFLARHKQIKDKEAHTAL